MRWFPTLTCLLLASTTLFSQLTEDFSDGELKSDPAWHGDTDDFRIANGELQLNAELAGASQIWTDVAFPDSVVWELYYRMEFPPSTSNALRVYLMLDTPAVDVASGYFLEIGESGSNDALYFNTLESGSIQLLVFSEGIFGGDPSTATLRVIRHGDGRWEFFADLDNSGNFTFLMAASDDTSPPGVMQHFALACTYSETRKDRFFFDDISISSIIPDTLPPQITEVTATSSTRLAVIFSEPILPDDALNTSLYTIDKGIGQPSFASMSAPHIVDLVLDMMLEDGQEYRLQVEEIRDITGNVLSLQSWQFTYTEVAIPGAYDILVNEIMADPSPVVGLPDAEYIEILNRSGKTIDLAGLVLRIGTSETAFEPYLLPPGAYAAIVEMSDQGLFNTFDNIVAVPSLPSLVNTGTTVAVESVGGTLLHAVTYSDTWYGDPAKDDGGWSLELINPLSPCSLQDNWVASTNLIGGTPGEANSVLDSSMPDNLGPTLISIFPVSTTVLSLTFNEHLGDIVPVVTIDPVVAIDAIFLNGTELRIMLGEDVIPGVLYTCTVEMASDCIGNLAARQTGTFALPQAAETGDLIINELLYDPRTGGSRYVELYNTSTKFIASSDLLVAEVIGTMQDVEPVTATFLIDPGTYIALTPDAEGTAMSYPRHDASRLIVSDLPSFGRSAGNVTVFTSGGVVLDSFDYSDAYHNPLLDITRGVSLERISVLTPTNLASSWQSAASTAGFGTPGLPNSQQVDISTSDGMYSIENRTFSPDGDGFEDFLLIHFTNPPPGAVVTLHIHDAHGREISRPLSNALVGQDGIATWDGTTSDGLRAPLGIYILLVEIVTAGGDVITNKEAIVLAARL